MIRSIAPGRWIFAIAILLFGLLALGHAIAPTFPALSAPWLSTGLSPKAAAAGDMTMPGGAPGGALLGLVLLAIGGGLQIDRCVRPVALALAALTVLIAGIAWLPELVQAPARPRAWTPFFELLAMAGAGLVLAGWFSDLAGTAQRSLRLVRGGQLLFAASLPVFFVLHFIYAEGIATLLPAWIPWHVFWIYFFGVAFLAAAVSLATGILDRLAGTLLGWMYLLWVVTLHLPRCVAARNNGDEWTSLLVALAWGGCSWIVAATAPSRQPPAAV